MEKNLSEHCSSAGISKLPEDCISNILWLTSPRDACRLSLVSPTFKSAADSDIVWEKFLPSDYHSIISQSVVPFNFNNYSSKKELFLHLCDSPILLDGGTKSFRLGKNSGKICLMIGARDLKFSFAGQHHGWQWTSRYQHHSRFGNVAELSTQRLFQIHGKVATRMISPKTTYIVYLVVRFTDHRYECDVEYVPIVVLSRFILGGCNGSHKALFKTPEGEVTLGLKRGDTWTEFVMGDFYNDQEQYDEVEMTFNEMKGLQYWGFGLIVEGIELRPKEENVCNV